MPCFMTFGGLVECAESLWGRRVGKRLFACPPIFVTRLRDGLPFVSTTVEYQGCRVTLENTLLDTGAVIGTISAEELQFLLDQLEEESETDLDYWLNRATLGSFQGARC